LKKLLRVIFLTRQKETNILKLILLKNYRLNMKIARTCFMLDFWNKINVFVKNVDIIYKWIVQKISQRVKACQSNAKWR
jgi:hypothetical protein